MSAPGGQTPITERIACWHIAYQAVLAELKLPYPDADGQVKLTDKDALTYLNTQRVDAARIAATLAIGATTRERQRDTTYGGNV